MVAPETPLSTAQELAERLRKTIMESRFSMPPNPVLTVTVSAGVAQQVKGEPVGNLISRADEALYRAKESGRNRVEISADV